MRNISQINSDLEALWTDTFRNQSNAYAPLPYTDPKHDAIVFVGLNPSFSLQGWNALLPYANSPNIEPSSFFGWPRPQGFDAELADELEELARERYRFYAHHKALAEALELPWEHIDLFAYRETDQSKAKPLVVDNESEGRLTSFGEAQFKLFEEVLCLAKPKAVIVVNALASQIYRCRRQPTFDSATGLYYDKTRTTPRFPVFFSGMLTGARALDRFSRDRLFWHVANALGKTWLPDASQETPLK